MQQKAFARLRQILPVPSQSHDRRSSHDRAGQRLDSRHPAFFVIGLSPLSAVAEEEKTPKAGKEFRTTLFGEEIYVPPRDRRSVTAVNFGINWIPNGPSKEEVLPFGALYIWRNWNEDNRQLRGTFSGVVNDINYTIGLRSLPNWSLLFTLDNFIAPIGRSEYVVGQRIKALIWNGTHSCPKQRMTLGHPKV